MHLLVEMGSRCDDDEDDGDTRFAILTELLQCIMSNALLVPAPSIIQRSAMCTCTQLTPQCSAHSSNNKSLLLSFPSSLHFDELRNASLCLLKSFPIVVVITPFSQ